MLSKGHNIFCHTDVFSLKEFYFQEPPENKKAGRFPVRENVGSAKNPLPRRQRNVQQDTKTQCVFAGISFWVAKELFLKLGGFTFSFAEITVKMSLETGFRGGSPRFRNTIYTLPREIQAVFPPFFGLFNKTRDMKDLPLRWGRARRASENSLALDTTFSSPRNANGEGFAG